MLTFMGVVCFLYEQICTFADFKMDWFTMALNYMKSNPETLEGEPSHSISSCKHVFNICVWLRFAAY